MLKRIQITGKSGTRLHIKSAPPCLWLPAILDSCRREQLDEIDQSRRQQVGCSHLVSLHSDTLSSLRAFELSSQSLSGSSLVPHSWTRYHFFFLSIPYFGFYMTARYSLQWRRLMKLIHSWSIELELELAIRDGQSNSIDSIQFSKKWKFESNFQLNSIQFNCTATSK